MKYILLFLFSLSGYILFAQLQINPPLTVRHLSAALQIKTVSVSRELRQDHINPFTDFIEWAEKSYPLIHSRLERKIVNNYSLLFHWKGANPDLLPALFIAHMDVVPADDIAHQNWGHPPFSGFIDSTFIWGRGAIDNKSQLVAMFEAIEQLLKINFVPSQSIYFAFGHDEELGGEEGAKKINEYFQSQQIQFQFILDEGGAIIKEAFPGLKQDIAFIATAEKGYMDVELSVTAIGGHSSLPPKQNPIDILSSAIMVINKYPMRPRLHDPTRQMMKTISPYLSLKNRLAVKHEKLFGKQILRKLSKDPFTNSLIRTVITPTLIHGGIKENVLPVSAVANLNIRIMPGDSIESVMNYLSGRINDERVKINMKAPFYNPSLVSSTDTKAWELLAELITSVFPGVAVAPFLFPATTDSHHYTGLSKNIYRFIPLKLNPEDREKIHGVGERIGIADYLQSIQFYSRLFQRL